MTSPASRAREPLLAAGFFGLSGVALGAIGAHALAARLAESGMARSWETGARYHLFHAVALLATAVWMRSATGAAARRMTWATRCWVLGIVLFSGSLYAFALGGPRWLVHVTPLGGVALMAGWLAVIVAAFANDE